jgi:uncharacterized protein
MKSKIFFALCFVVLPACALSQVTVSVAPEAASKEDVQKLFDVMASRDQMHQMMQQVFAQMRSLNREQIKKRHPDVTDEELARLDRQSEDFIKNFPVDEMLNDMVPIYQRHFTKSEIDSLTTFYSSPAGQKFLHEMPSVTAESMKVLFPRVQAEVESALKRAEEKEEKTDSPK